MLGQFLTRIQFSNAYGISKAILFTYVNKIHFLLYNQLIALIRLKYIQF